MEEETDDFKIPQKSEKSPISQHATENILPLPYKEPPWSGLPKSPSSDYSFDVLKSGSIIENLNLMDKTLWVFGRLANCDISMAHPTISRYHAILQYRIEATDEEPAGFYLYDLSSTHGTFLNKNRLKPRVYARVQVGHMIKLGCSSRTYIMTGPEEDTEAVSELSVTELKQKRAEELLKREEAEREAKLKAEQEEAARKKKDEERGVDWGMGEDADEETDLAENPYAQTNNEELYLDDPKKALRGFMEREGLDLEYDCSEQGMGQFLCKVILPIDDDKGRSIVAEVLHKGKKKEAVVQCALEACRILDRHGLLRQATHESRKRKAKNWEDNDYYDSDDDTFLDQTGTIEKKREARMKAKLPQQPETYQSLLEKEKNINEQITHIEKQLEASRWASASTSAENEDSLDSYMKELKQPKLDKQKVIKLKTDLTKLKQEHANVIKLVNIARPADLPPLVAVYASTSTSTTSKAKLPIFGKRIKVKVQKPVHTETIEEPESSEDETPEPPKPLKDQIAKTCLAQFREKEEQVLNITKCLSEQHKEVLSQIFNNLKKLAANEDRIHSDVKALTAKKNKILTYVKQLAANFNHKLDHKVSAEMKRIFQELENMGNQRININQKVDAIAEKLLKLVEGLLQEAIKQADDILKKKSERLDKENSNEFEAEKMEDKPIEEAIDDDEEESERKRKKNQRRIQQRQVKTEVEKQKGYEEDAAKEDYNMWVPPTNQTGDGRTSLNEKFGY